MNPFVRIIVAFMLICFSPGVNAQDREVKLQLGVGVICNSAEQIDRYLALLKGDDSSSSDAVQIVNDEAENPIACGVAAIAFVPDKLIRTLTTSDNVIKVMRIKVLGIPTENGCVKLKN
jgi:hypothetical protein